MSKENELGMNDIELMYLSQSWQTIGIIATILVVFVTIIVIGLFIGYLIQQIESEECCYKLAKIS